MPSASPGTECARVRAIGRFICDDRCEDDGEKGNAEAEDEKNGGDEVCVVESLPLHDTCQYFGQFQGTGGAYHGHGSNSEISKTQQRHDDAAS